MSRVKALTREQLGDKAYAMAVVHGLGSLSVRSLATACGVAPGTIYNYLPTKSDLLTAVVGRFWREELSDAMNRSITPGDDYIEFCRDLLDDVVDALQKFRRDWLPELVAAGQTSRGSTQMFEYPEAIRAIEHMRQGLERVLVSDPRVIRERLEGELSAERITHFTMSIIMELASSSEREARANLETFFAMLRLTLYAKAPEQVRKEPRHKARTRTELEEKSGS